MAKMWVLIYIVAGFFLAPIIGTRAYHWNGDAEGIESWTCNQFVTKLGEGFQMRALSLQNISDDWMTASAVSEKCQGKIFRADGFEGFMTKYPTVVKYSVKLGTDTLVDDIRLNVLASWGDLTDDMRALCDFHGNAYFLPPTGLVGTGAFFPQAVGSVDLIKGTGATIDGQFTLQLKSSEGSDPIFGEGFLITPVICRIRPEETESKQVVWAPRDFVYTISLTTELRHWWGLLHPEMWSELALLACIAAPKLLLVLWFFYKCRMFQDHVMSQQRYFLMISAASFFSSMLFLLFLVVANGNGADTCCPTPAAAAFLQGLKVMSNMAFDLLVLATAKGWGVVTPKLDVKEQRKILLFFLMSIIVYLMSQVLRPSFQIAWLVVINETSIWIWIFMCLKQTKHDLTLSSRLDRHSKIEMYTKLHRLLLIGLGLWCLIVTIEIWAVLIIFNKDGRIILFDIPPTLAWDLSLLLMMYGFAWIWRPSPATAQFSYTFTRQEEDGLDARDPVNEFGLESS